MKIKAERELKKRFGNNKKKKTMIKKKELLERIEQLEERVNCLECYADKLYDENEHLLYHLNTILGRNPACADPLPYDSSVDALVEILKQQKRTIERPQPNYDAMIARVFDRLSKLELNNLQGNIIKEKADEIIYSAEKVINSFDLVKFAKDLFMPEKTQKKAKPSEKTKPKCECEKKSCKKGGK